MISPRNFLLTLALLVQVGLFAQPFYSPEGKFSIAFRAQPTRSAQDVPTDMGAIRMTMFMHEKSPTEAYMAAYNDYPEALVAQADPYVLLEGAKNGAVENMNIRIYAEEKTTHQGYPAYLFKAAGADQTRMISKIVLVGNRMYQAMAILMGEETPEANQFVLSLQIDQAGDSNSPSQIELLEPIAQNAQLILKPGQRVKLRVEDKDGVELVLVNGTQAFADPSGYYLCSPTVVRSQLVVQVRDAKQVNTEIIYPLSDPNDLQPANNEKRLALLVGNADYSFGGSLRNPLNDIRAMKTALELLGFDVMLAENCTQRDLKKAMDEFGDRLTQYQIGLFFYAGHGIQVNGINYLVPVDAQMKSKNDVDYDCVDTGRLLSKMEGAKNPTNIIILDACRDNPFERSWSRSTAGAGLAFMNAPSGSLIAYATSPGKTASDGNSGQNGLYTSALLQHIHTPGISIHQLFQRVRKEVMEQSQQEQVPWESTSLSGDFYFKK